MSIFVSRLAKFLHYFWPVWHCLAKFSAVPSVLNRRKTENRCVSGEFFSLAGAYLMISGEPGVILFYLDAYHSSGVKICPWNTLGPWEEPRGTSWKCVPLGAEKGQSLPSSALRQQHAWDSNIQTMSEQPPVMLPNPCRRQFCWKMRPPLPIL